MIETDLAYIAGFIDGEGSISLYLDQNNKSLSLKVAVYQNDTLPLEFIESRFGGGIYLRPAGGYQKADNYAITLYADSAANLLRSIEKYLIVKRDVAAFCLLVWERRTELDLDQAMADYKEVFGARYKHEVKKIEV